MLASLTRIAPSVLALLLMYLGLAAPSVRAQALPRPFVVKLIKQRIRQAYAVEAQIQQMQQLLAQVQATAPFAVSNVQSAISQEQAALAQIQTQINLLTQLLATEDQAFVVWDLIQKIQKRINAVQQPGKKKHSEHEDKKKHSKHEGKGTGAVAQEAETAALQTLLAALQAQLAQLQAQINALQAQIVV
jgi:hypothetical protein